MGGGEAPPALEVAGVWKRYGGRWVLRGVSLRLAQGERLVVLGPNGSGKTTLVKLVMGLAKPDRGVVRVFGIRVGSRDFDRVRRGIGFMPERASLPGNLTVEDYLALFAKLRGCDYSDAAEALGLTRYYRARVAALSQGYRRRLMLAVALLCKPRLVVLDEPYANIDVASRFAIDEFLEDYARGSTLLMTSHVRPGLTAFRSILMIGGVVVGELTYEGDYVELHLACGGERETLRLSASVRPGELGRLNVMVARGCRIEGVDIVTFDRLIYEVLRRHDSVEGYP